MDWPSAAAIGTAAAVVGALTPFILRWLDRRRFEQPPTQARQPPKRDRSVMLRRVRSTWITGVLEPSLAEVARLTLGLQHRPEVLDLGTRTRRSAGRPPRPLPVGTPISEVFDKAAGGLLILGEPGAGKTTLLLRLADELLVRAEGDADQPIPVVANLASWARRRQPLATWLVEELMLVYTMPERTIRAWVDADALVLLLDGLDEVAEAHRPACAEAINAYRREHGVVPMVVCSRTQELQDLAPSCGPSCGWTRLWSCSRPATPRSTPTLATWRQPAPRLRRCAERLQPIRSFGPCCARHCCCTWSLWPTTAPGR